MGHASRVERSYSSEESRGSITRLGWHSTRGAPKRFACSDKLLGDHPAECSIDRFVQPNTPRNLAMGNLSADEKLVACAIVGERSERTITAVNVALAECSDWSL
jgi:hypothetical protein